MPRYNYLCLDCQVEAEQIKGAPLEGDELLEVVFETTHTMNPSVGELAAARECPRCHSQNSEKTMIGVAIHHYVRGYGYLDREGCTRDRNVFQLVERDRETGDSLDPYEGMRIPGEKDELVSRFRRAGKQPVNPKHYPMPGEEKAMQEAVQRAVAQGPVSGDETPAI